VAGRRLDDCTINFFGQERQERIFGQDEQDRQDKSKNEDVLSLAHSFDRSIALGQRILCQDEQDRQDDFQACILILLILFILSIPRLVLFVPVPLCVLSQKIF
jgi:hypothetical protein